MIRLLLLLLLLPLPALAGPPKVVADIPPVHSLVARVMQGVGAPALLLAPGASPHGYAMRPSEAALLQEAEVVFWVGPALTPWLERAVGALGRAEAVSLLAAEGTVHRAWREGAVFGGHDDHDHGDGDDDPHAWLDPENGKAWLAAIAATLAAADPANAGVYHANAQEGAVEIDRASARIRDLLAPLRGAVFVVYHDGFHHFEHRFGFEAAGAVTGGDASAPSAARIDRLRTLLAGAEGACVFAEPRIPERALWPVTEGLEVGMGALDALGVAITPGPALYPALIEGIAASLAECLGR
jgi:zinc transport system substrate-binding protein